MRSRVGIGLRLCCTTLLLLGVVLNVFAAKKKLPKTVITSWTLPGFVAIADTQSIDSSYLNFPMRDVLYDYSPLNQFNGNLVSPVQSALYFYRTHKTDFLFAHPYDPYTTTPQDVRFYNTTTPYSIISYKRSFTTYHEDNDLGFLFTGNINRRTNVGMTMNYLDAVGHYKSQAGKTFNGSVFTSYNGDHYSLQAAFTFNRLSNFENGGLMDPSDLQNKDMKTEDMPVNLEAMSGFRYISGYLNHYYSITKQRTDTVHYRERDDKGKLHDKDSLKTTHIPLLTFRHVFETNDATRRYIEKDAAQAFYTDRYLNSRATHDSTGLTTVRNTLSVTFEEAYNRRLHFGATVFAVNEFQRHSQNRLPDYAVSETLITNLDINSPQTQTIGSTRMRHWSNNTFVGGAIYKQTGKYIRYKASGDVCLAGRKLGEFHIDGDINAGFRMGKDSMTLGAHFRLHNETPDYFFERYVSNHYQWNNDFKRTYRMRVGGQVAYPTKWFTTAVKVDYEMVNKLIYFDLLQQGVVQSDKTLSVLAADVQANLTTPWLNLDNHVVYQYASSYILAVPTITLYHNLYYHGTWFKALDAQIGVDLTYSTAYYAPYLNAANGQFAPQKEIKIGNYPILSVYANFYVRLLHLRFFAQYQHFNATFMNRQFYGMATYPLNPDVFRAGLAFHFYK